MIKIFKALQGVLSNPYIGFTSFQHFRDEALYSDCISGRSEIAGTETENYECYPVPSGVEEKGREQGYHPDTTVAYIRILWKEFEPKQGQYNYEIVESILQRAKEKGQTVMFRLMPHSTCERDDVPDWLKKLIDCPARPAGMRVKDSPKDPLYLELFGKAIEQLGQRFDSDPTLDIMDVSLGGCWGEGSGFPDEDLKKLMDIYIRVFPNTKLLGQVGNINMLNHIGAHHSIGVRADGFGSPVHMKELYPPRFARLDPDHWKTAPVSFEAYWWISEWYRQGWDLDKIIEKTLAWHISTFNNKSFPIQYEWQDKIEYWLSKMGYRFHLQQIEYPDAAVAGVSMDIAFTLENKGVAPIYNRLPLRFLLKNAQTTCEFVTDIDIRSWLPGEHCERITLTPPSDLPEGVYDLCCAIGGKDMPSVKLATELACEGDIHHLATITVTKGV